jgi:hypothetical protein
VRRSEDGEPGQCMRAPACTAAVSQHRQINLPVSHGAYVNGKPLMIKTDRTPDTIPYCGICSSQNNISLTIDP